MANCLKLQDTKISIRKFIFNNAIGFHKFFLLLFFYYYSFGISFMFSFQYKKYNSFYPYTKYHYKEVE